MKYINKKVIKGKAYYYLQYKNYTKNLGEFLPPNLPEKILDFFYEIAKKEIINLSDEIKNKFKYGKLDVLEGLHYFHIALNHDLLKKLHYQFYDEFIRLFTYHSNRSEGSKTSKKEIDKFVQSNIKNPKTKTELEIWNSFLAFKHALSKDMKWTMKSIKHIHELLLNGIDPMIAGKWKNEDNIIANQLTTEYKKVPKEVKNLIQWLKKEFKKNTYPPELALKFYCRFEKIHPFLDGNGRVGRILLNAILHKFNYPPIIFFTENHKEHSTAIKYALKGRWGKMNKHFLKQAEKTNNILVKK